MQSRESALEPETRLIALRELRRAQVGDIELAYETLGDASDPPLVLVMGLGAQLHYWPDPFCRELADRGLFVVRFDNRDVGHSTHLEEAGPVDLASVSPGTSLPYTMSDMAADVVGLIRALGLRSAHLVGMSLGGMIVQLTAIEHPERVRSLVSIASTTGGPDVGQSRPEALAALFTPPPELTREAIGDHAVRLSRLIGSTGFPLDERWLRERAQRSFDRRYDPEGVSRQAATVGAAGDRTSRLAQLRIPALVIHGRADPLVDVSGGIATARAIPGAELLVIEGMGHDLPPGAWTQIVEGIERTVRRAEVRPSRR
jgi:pimeloyl-ACP methyl ester carboxylesterase